MVFEERGERIDDLKLILGRVAEVRNSRYTPVQTRFNSSRSAWSIASKSSATDDLKLVLGCVAISSSQILVSAPEHPPCSGAGHSARVRLELQRR